MVPTIPYQLDYQEFGLLVESHISIIRQYERDNNIKFNGVLAKLRNGTIPASIIATHLGLLMGVISIPRMGYEVDIVSLPPNFNKDLPYTILYIDSFCGTGESLNDIQNFIIKTYPNITFVSYATLVDEKSKYKPTIVGQLENRFIQPPWEYNAFTPDAHLERLMADSGKCFIPDSFSFLFPSKETYEQLEFILGKNIDVKKIPENINVVINKKELSLEKTVQYILKNGVTHYFDMDNERAIEVALRCPVIKVYLLVNDMSLGFQNFTQKILKINVRKESTPYIEELLF